MNLRHTFLIKKIEISFPITQGNDYDLTLDLFEEIVPETAKATVLLNKIDILLEKKKTN